MKILLIGAGNVGHSLAERLHQIGMPAHQIFGRKEGHAAFAESVSAQAIVDLNDAMPDPDLCIIAVKDGAIGEVAEKLSQVLRPETPVVHTSGATPSSVLAPWFGQFGVFYPLQTFSLGNEPSWEGLPICVFSNENRLANLLLDLARQLGAQAQIVDDGQRAALHVAAVFVNNFTNHLYRIGFEICQQEQLPFEMLRPLILATANKLATLSPAEAQTGPAARRDVATIERHLAYLNAHFPGYVEVYQMMTGMIWSDDFSRPKP